MGFFDSHSHLNDEKFDEDRDKIIKEIYESGTTNFITAGYSVESSKKQLKYLIIMTLFMQLLGFLQMIFHKLKKNCGNS